MYMKLNENLEAMKKEYEEIEIPEGGMEGLMNSINKAKEERRRQRRSKKVKWAAGCVAAALAVVILLPNVSSTAAMAMERIPVLGGVVRVVTFGRYDFEDDHHQANVEIPNVELESEGETNSLAAQLEDELNQEVQDYINTIVDTFKSTLDEESANALDIRYEVVMNTTEWFTLRLNVTETQASGFMYSKLYHIDKESGQIKQLKDLFLPESDYVTVISENIKEQMREQMAADESKMYFLDSEEMPEDDFQQIKEDQNFYFNKSGQIVIVFDEYEVAPGYMGIVEFAVPTEVTEPLMK